MRCSATATSTSGRADDQTSRPGQAGSARGDVGASGGGPSSQHRPAGRHSRPRLDPGHARASRATGTTRFIAKFEETHPDIKVEREWFPRAEMHAKQLALAATGQIGDTVRINVAPVVSELQLKGVVRELDSLFASDTQWTGNDQKQFWPGNIRTYTRDGKLWGLPVVGHPGAVQYYINRTMVEKAGLKMPPGDGNWTLRRRARRWPRA